MTLKGFDGPLKGLDCPLKGDYLLPFYGSVPRVCKLKWKMGKGGRQWKLKLRQGPPSDNLNCTPKIWDYTYEVWSENQADRYCKLMLDFCQELAESPYLGKKYEDIHSGLLG